MPAESHSGFLWKRTQTSIRPGSRLSHESPAEIFVEKFHFRTMFRNAVSYSRLRLQGALGAKKSLQKSQKKLRKNLQVKKKGVPLQSLSETGVLQEPRGTPKSHAEGTEKFIEKTERKKLPSPK